MTTTSAAGITSTEAAANAKAAFEYIRREAGQVSVSVKSFFLQCYDETRTMDREKAKALGSKYKGNVVGAAQKLRELDREKIAGGYRKLREMDRAAAKEKFQSLPKGAKIKYGILLFLFLFAILVESPSKAQGFGKMEKHPRLCYVRDEKKRNKFLGCEKMLQGPTKGKTAWIFLGNEPLFTLVKPFKHLRNPQNPNDPTFPFMHLKADNFKPEKNKVYYQYEEMDKDLWESTYLEQGEKPIEIATEHYGQTPCRTCEQMKMKSITQDFTLEVLTVETSRDVFIPTKDTLTTQETVTRYISDNYDKDKTVCFVQIGNNYEMDKARWRPSIDYLTHTNNFHKMLQQDACGVLIRLSSFPHYGMKEKSVLWNNFQREMLLTDPALSSGYYIDLSHVRSPTWDTYNLPMLEMLTRLMGTPAYHFKQN